MADRKVSDLNLQTAAQADVGNDYANVVHPGASAAADRNVRMTLTEIAKAVVQYAASFVQSGTGALARDAQSKLRDLVNVADFTVNTSYTTAMGSLAPAIGMGLRFNNDGFLNPGATTASQPFIELRGKNGVDQFIVSHYNFGHMIDFRNSNQAVEFHGWDNTAAAWTTVLTIEPIPNGGGRIWVRNAGDTDGIQIAMVSAGYIRPQVSATLDFGVADTNYARLTAKNFAVYGNSVSNNIFLNYNDGGLGLVGTTAGDLYLGAAGTNSWIVQATTGHMFAATNNTYDIGGTSNAPRSIYAGTSFKVGSNQVVAARDTGWTAMTGSPDKATSYATSTVTLAQLAGRVAQLQASLTTHGLIGA